jgi:hypothetical protein
LFNFFDFKLLFFDLCSLQVMLSVELFITLCFLDRTNIVEKEKAIRITRAIAVLSNPILEGRISYKPIKPNKTNITAESHLKVRSGSRLQKTTPTIIPRPSATNMAMVAPTKTLIAFWYCATKLIVASWVLSPNSAIKNAMATVVVIPNREAFLFSFWGLSPLTAHKPKAMNESEAAIDIMSIGIIVVKSWPTATVIAKQATIAMAIPRITL